MIVSSVISNDRETHVTKKLQLLSAVALQLSQSAEQQQKHNNIDTMLIVSADEMLRKGLELVDSIIVGKREYERRAHWTRSATSKVHYLSKSKRRDCFCFNYVSCSMHVTRDRLRTLLQTFLFIFFLLWLAKVTIVASVTVESLPPTALVVPNAVLTLSSIVAFIHFIIPSSFWRVVGAKGLFFSFWRNYSFYLFKLVSAILS